MKTKIKIDEYNDVLKYAEKKKLKSIVNYLQEMDEDDLIPKTKIVDLITWENLMFRGCYHFLQAARQLKFKKSNFYGDYTEELKMFDKEKLIINKDEFISEKIINSNKFDECVKLNFEYIEEVLDQINDTYKNYTKIDFETFQKMTFTPEQFLTEGIFMTKADYEVDSLSDFPKKFKFVYIDSSIGGEK